MKTDESHLGLWVNYSCDDDKVKAEENRFLSSSTSSFPGNVTALKISHWECSFVRPKSVQAALCAKRNQKERGQRTHKKLTNWLALEVKQVPHTLESADNVDEHKNKSSSKSAPNGCVYVLKANMRPKNTNIQRNGEGNKMQSVWSVRIVWESFTLGESNIMHALCQSSATSRAKESRRRQEDASHIILFFIFSVVNN